MRRIGWAALLLLGVGCARGRDAACQRYHDETAEVMRELADAEKAVTEHVTPDARGAAMMRRIAEETESGLGELLPLAPKYAPLADAHRALITATAALPTAYRAWADAAENADAARIAVAEQRVRALLQQRLTAAEEVEKVCR